MHIPPLKTIRNYKCSAFFGKGGEIKQMLLCTCRYLYKGLRVEYKALILKAFMKSILESNKINTQITKMGVTFI